jgi:hypothetical protein
VKDNLTQAMKANEDVDVSLRSFLTSDRDMIELTSRSSRFSLKHFSLYIYIYIYIGCFKKSFTTILISNAGALAVAVLGTTVPRA